MNDRTGHTDLSQASPMRISQKNYIADRFIIDPYSSYVSVSQMRYVYPERYFEGLQGYVEIRRIPSKRIYVYKLCLPLALCFFWCRNDRTAAQCRQCQDAHIF